MNTFKIFLKLKYQEIIFPFTKRETWTTIFAIFLVLCLIVLALVSAYGIGSGIGYLVHNHTETFQLDKTDSELDSYFELGLFFILAIVIMIGIPSFGLYILYKLGKWIRSNWKQAKRIAKGQRSKNGM